MGNNKSNGMLDVLRPSKPNEWVREGSTGYCEVVRNTLTGQIAEQYSVAVDGRLSQQDNLARYQYRSTNNQFIVGVYQVEKEDSQFMCQGQEHVKVFTERIPQRLSEVGRVTTEEGLYVLRQTLQGFRTIYELHGTTHINDDMIGLTPDGKVKVWLNDNLAANLPDPDNRSTHQNEMVMVDQITDIVKEHIAGNAFPYRLREMMTQHPPNTFEEALAQLQSYLQASRTNLPSGIRSLKMQPNIQPNLQTNVQTNVQRDMQSNVQPNHLLVEAKPTGQIQKVQPKSVQRTQPQTHQSIRSEVTQKTQQSPQVNQQVQPQPARQVQSGLTQQQTLQTKELQSQQVPTTQPPSIRQQVPQTQSFMMPRAQTVHSKPPIAPSVGSSKPSITINIPFGHGSSSTTSFPSGNPQQQSQIIQRSPGALDNQQFVRQVGAYNKSTAVYPSANTATNSRVMRTDGSHSAVTSTSMTQSVHQQQPAQSASQIRTVGGVSAASAKVELTQGRHQLHRIPQPFVNRNGSTSVLQAKQPLSSGAISSVDSTAKQPSLQSQIEKLKEVTKLVGIKSESSSSAKIEASKGASFVSPSTETKHIKFEAQPIKEKEQIFVRAQQVTNPSHARAALNRKESSSQLEPHSNVGFIKATRPSNPQAISSTLFEQQKYIPMQHTASNPNLNMNSNQQSGGQWTTPKEVTSMEPLKVGGSATKISTGGGYTSGSDRSKVITVKSNVSVSKATENTRSNEPVRNPTAMPSEMDELDALQNRLSEIVNKTKKLTEPMEQRR